jgi:hypothetical protein
MNAYDRAVFKSLLSNEKSKWRRTMIRLQYREWEGFLRSLEEDPDVQAAYAAVRAAQRHVSTHPIHSIPTQRERFITERMATK